MQALRWLGVAAAALGAAGWMFQASNLTNGIAGLGVFALLATCFLVRGFAANFWLESSALAGLLVIFMGPGLLIVGGILLAPAVMLGAGRLWIGVQDEIAKASRVRRKGA